MRWRGQALQGGQSLEVSIDLERTPWLDSGYQVAVDTQLEEYAR